METKKILTSADRVLTLVAGIFFLTWSVLNIFFGYLLLQIWLPFFEIAHLATGWGAYELKRAATMMVVPWMTLFIVAIFGLIFGYLCIQWRKSPFSHKGGLLLAGLITLLLCGISYLLGALWGVFGILPSILAIIASFLAK